MIPGTGRAKIICASALASLVLLLITFLLVSCDESGSTCERPGSMWCKDNTIVACLNERIDGYVRRAPVFEEGVDCGDYDGECVSWDELNAVEEATGLRKAGCAAPGQECTNVGESLCRDDRVIMYCEPAFRYVMYGCSGNYCVYDADDRAVCAYYQGTCTDDDEMCDPGGEAKYLRCNNGAWSYAHSCSEGQVCVQTSATEADCISEATTATSQ